MKNPNMKCPEPYKFSTNTNHITLEDIYTAFSIKDPEYAIELYAVLEGVTEASARLLIGTLYRVFHIGYEDCLRRLDIEHIPNFANHAQSNAWRAGFSHALKLPSLNLHAVETSE